MKITRCKLLRKQQLRLLEYLVLAVTARSAADVLGIQPNSAALYYCKLREVIAYHLEQKEHEVFDGPVELDESYFGGVRKGKRCRGAAGKVAVFGILKRGGKVYTKMVNDTRTETLMPCMWVLFIMKGSITRHYLPGAGTTLMVLRTFGTKPSVC